jgi:SAM-dependent methyltransferase
VHDVIKDYYGRRLQSTQDLKTSACCDATAAPAWLAPLLERVHPAVRARYYGCGLVLPDLLEGARVLDLGCGAGRDVYLLAQIVGREGAVVGVDMTDEQLTIAEDWRGHHAEAFGFANVEFRKGFIERLDQLDLTPGSFDVVVSNCVVNLSPDKEAVFRGVRRLLKPGGEFYFADIYADRRLSRAAREHPEFAAECLGGALYRNDFRRIAARAGFPDQRLVAERPIAVDDPLLAEIAAGARFYSATYRLFAVDGLEDACEDYGQAVVYRGAIPHHPQRFVLDRHHVIETGRVFPACGNTFRILNESRFAPQFDFIGDFSRHFGLFKSCGDAPSAAAEPASGACCA